jgi:hypothetical protein
MSFWDRVICLVQREAKQIPQKTWKTHPSMAAAVFSRLERISVYSAHSRASTQMSTQQRRPQRFPAFHSFIALDEEHTIGF